MQEAWWGSRGLLSLDFAGLNRVGHTLKSGPFLLARTEVYLSANAPRFLLAEVVPLAIRDVDNVRRGRIGHM